MLKLFFLHQTASMDRLIIQGLKIMTPIGIYPWEKKILQPLYLDIEFPIDATTSHNNLSLTIDYEALCNCVDSYLKIHHFQLIETLANDLAHHLKTQFQLQQIQISVEKPLAIRNAKNIRCTVLR